MSRFEAATEDELDWPAGRPKRRRWEVVRLDHRFNPAEVLGAYNWRWLAEQHCAWANIGIRFSFIRDAHRPGIYEDPSSGEPRDAETGRFI